MDGSREVRKRYASQMKERYRMVFIIIIDIYMVMTHRHSPSIPETPRPEGLKTVDVGNSFSFVID